LINHVLSTLEKEKEKIEEKEKGIENVCLLSRDFAKIKDNTQLVSRVFLKGLYRPETL